MSGYNGRPAPNVSRYIADLNTVPARDESVDSPPNLDAELALFTNNEFIDWDGVGVENSFRNPSLDIDLEQPAQTAGVSEPKMDFTNLNSKCRAIIIILLCLCMSSFLILPLALSFSRSAGRCVTQHVLAQLVGGMGRCIPRHTGCIAPSPHALQPFMFSQRPVIHCDPAAGCMTGKISRWARRPLHRSTQLSVRIWQTPRLHFPSHLIAFAFSLTHHGHD